jgi:hypothetical protein
MKTYEINVKHNHKGSRYPVTSVLKIEASSAAVAVAKAIKQVKKTYGRSYREPVGATISIFVIVTGHGRREADDGGRGRVQLTEES